jgi:DNA-binding transcriptional MerR regulator
MRTTLSIGDFSRATLLSIKTLRHYHEVGLLEPAQIEPSSGHRRYTTAQIPTAQVIRRFRSLEMPIDEIRALLSTPELDARNDVIATHLDRLEETLERTSAAVASLRDLLRPTSAPTEQIEHRLVGATPAAAIHEMVEGDELALWFEGAFGEIYATLAAQGATPDGPAGGVYGNDLFAYERGEATVFVPCKGHFRPSGRVEAVIVPPAELAIATHLGHHDQADRTYGALAQYVADHELAVDGPIREYYLVGRRQTADAGEWRTEIGWPIFRVGQSSPVAN